MSDENKKRWIGAGKSAVKILGSVLACALLVLTPFNRFVKDNKKNIEDGIRIGMEIATEEMKKEIQEVLNNRFRIYDGAILIIVKGRLNSISRDMQGEFANDIRPGDIESVLGLYALLDDTLKSPGMDLVVENIRDFYKRITGGSA
jgi:hypothetical protein